MRVCKISHLQSQSFLSCFCITSQQCDNRGRHRRNEKTIHAFEETIERSRCCQPCLDEVCVLFTSLCSETSGVPYSKGVVDGDGGEKSCRDSKEMSGDIVSVLASNAGHAHDGLLIICLFHPSTPLSQQHRKGAISDRIIEGFLE